MNKVSPKALLHSKWTKVEVENINKNKEKHFIVTKVKTDEEQRIVMCVIEAVISHKEYAINWRDLKNSLCWKTGWQ
jgi:tryptophan-rich hypothetical protein